MAELRWIADGWAHSIDMPEREAIEKAGMMWRRKECEMVEVIRRSYIIFRRQKKVYRMNLGVGGISKAGQENP